MNTKEVCYQTHPDLSITGSNSLILLNPFPCNSDEVEVAEKTKRIRQRMRKVRDDTLEELVMVDTIQRLGIEHLFQQEITEVLHRHYVDGCSNGLHEVSLRFRLLRQQGYQLSACTFDGFLGKDGKFNEELGKDTQGLVSLFEASQVSTHGECVLEEAGVFSKRILSAALEKLDKSEDMLVKAALQHPHQKTITRFVVHDSLTMLSSTTEDWRNDLQELAKIDFNIAQKIYHSEILHISKWWKKLGLAKELKFARDQPLKWHMWSLAALTDWRLSDERIDMTKPISFIYIIDDIFDVYGSAEDLSLFTEAVNMWKFDTLDMLPDYMKLCLKALFSVTSEISHRIWLKYGINPKDSLQKSWADLFNAFLVEYRWLAAGYVPTTAEYLDVATVTSGAHVVLTHMYFLLGGKSDTYDSNGRVLDKDYTRIMASTAKILRLWDDLGSSEDEGQDGHDGSYIKCYMNEHESVTNEAAREHVVDLISGTWKSLNKELMQSPPYPLSKSIKAFNRGCLNLVRMVPLMYNFDANHKLPDLENFVTSLLYQRY